MPTTNEMLSAVIDALNDTCRKTYYKPEQVRVYAEPKCPYCDKTRTIHATAPNGQELIDKCRCAEKHKHVWTAKPYEVPAYVLTEQDSLAVVIPSKVDRNGAILMSWWVDPSPKDSPYPASLLDNSLFTTEEKFRAFCLETGMELFENGMEIVRY